MKIVKGLFFNPETNENVYFKVKIAPSQIPNGGMGAYAVDRIPKNLRGVYRGAKKKRYENVDPYYSWEVNEFDPETGEELCDGEKLYYIDCHDPKTGNWARYVNCGMKRSDNNLEGVQYYGKMYYITARDILPGEEMFIDYGEGYRTEYLNINDADY